MNLQELIDLLTALTPTSTREARVAVNDANSPDTDVVSVGYEHGTVTITVEDLDANGDYDDGYEDGYEDGKRDGLREAEEQG